MVSLRDRVLLQLGNPDGLATALLPTGDTVGQRVRTMLAAAYDLTAVRFDRVTAVTVRDLALEQPLVPVGRRVGVWQQTVPSYHRSDLTMDVPVPTEPVWVDVLAHLDVSVVAEVDPAGAERVLAHGFDQFTTFDEFRARFQFIDLDAFLARHHISTVEELRDAFDYIVTEVQLRQPGPFDGTDPANAHTVPVGLAVVAVDPFDLAEGLRAARRVGQAARDLIAKAPATLPAEPIAAYATAVVLTRNSVVAGDPSDTEVEQLFAREGVVSLFLN
jgi:hypothetical protein